MAEQNPGLANARLKGIQESAYDILLFCDDDNWLASDYLSFALPILQNDKQIAVLGGIGKEVSDVAFPAWFLSHQAFFAVGKQMSQSGLVKGVRNVVYGAGMIVRKPYFIELQEKGFAFFNLGRTGGKITSGEDSEMCLAFQIAGYKIWYDENLQFQHYIDPKRLTKDYLLKLKSGMESSRYISRFYLEYLNGYAPKVSRYFWLKELVYLFNDSIKMMFSFNKVALKRNSDFAKYLLSERTRYNKNVQLIVNNCLSLSKVK